MRFLEKKIKINTKLKKNATFAKKNTYMKFIKIFLIVSLFCFVSCDKYNSKITGKVVYTDANDGIDYPAAGAVVSRMVQKGDSLHLVVAVFADKNGEFVFEHITKGNWILQGRLEIEEDSTTTTSYFGLSENFTTNGEDKVEKTLILKPLTKEESE